MASLIQQAREKIASLRKKTQATPLAQGYSKFASQPLPKSLQPLNERLGSFIQSPVGQFGSNLISSQNLGLTPISSAPVTGAQKTGAILGSLAGSLNPKSVTGKVVKGISTVVNPLIKTAISPVVKSSTNKLVPAIASGIGNIAQGAAINPAFGQKMTPQGAAIDFIVGAVGGPKQFNSALFEQPKIKIPKDDAKDFWAAAKVLKEYTPEQYTNDKYGAIKDLKALGRGYLTKLGYKPSQIKVMSPEEIVEALKGDVLANTQARAGYSPLRVGITDQTSRGLTPEVATPSKVLPGNKPLKPQEVGQKNLQVVGEKTVSQADNITNGSGSQVDPVQKITQLLREAKPMRGQQEALYSAERSRRVAKLTAIGKSSKGEKGFYAQLGALKGELPKIEFSRIRQGLTQPDIDSLFSKIEDFNMSPFEKISAKTGLSKLLGAEGGQIPTRSELKLLNETFGKDFVSAIQEKRPFIQKLFSGLLNALNVPRSIMATADLSAPLRQGIFFISKPKQWVPAFKEMFKYAGSEKAYEGLMDQIKSRPNYQLMRENKLALTDIGDSLLSREEEFMSTLPEKIPGFGVLAKGSNRAYSGFLNKLRADVFDDLVQRAKDLKVDNPQTISNIANFVNTGTGRGDLGKFSGAAELLNATFFSPKLMASRLQLMNPNFYIKLDPFTRKEALKTFLSTAGVLGSVLGLAKLSGAEVGSDPRSANFGKIKIGNTRYDILGGFQQYIKLASQLISGQVISSESGKLITLGEGYKPLTRKDIAIRFFESKTSPVASFIINLLTGQTGTGEPVNLTNEIVTRFIPMMAQDMHALAQEWGPKGLLMGVPGIFGAGSQTYGRKELVTGTNLAGEPTAQVRPVQGLSEKITERIQGPQPLGSSSSWNLESYYEQLKSMPKDQAAQQFDRLIKTNPEAAKKMLDIIKKRQQGITIQDEVLKQKGVASGDRAKGIAKQLNKLKTKEEKAKLWEDYVRKGITNADVSKQLKILLNQ